MLLLKIANSVKHAGTALATIEEEPQRTTSKAGTSATGSEQPAKHIPTACAAMAAQSAQDITNAPSGSLVMNGAAAEPHYLGCFKAQVEWAFSASSVEEAYELVSLAQALHLDKVLQYSKTATHTRRDAENNIK